MVTKARVVRAPTGPLQRRPSPQRTRVVSARRLAAESAADQLLEQARQRADALLEQAQQQAQELVQQGRQRGADQAAALLLGAQRQAQDVVQRAEAQLTELALAIAERVLHAELRLEPAHVRALVQSCLHQMAGPEPVTVRLNPLDLPQVEPLLQQPGASGGRRVTLEPDPGITRGGCVLETALGQVDASLETQLSVVRAALEQPG